MNQTNESEPSLLRVDIEGMTCPNCETLIERRFAAIPGVRSVSARAADGAALIDHDGSVDIAALQASLHDEIYRVAPAGEGVRARNTGRDYLEIAAALVIVLGLYLLLKRFNLAPDSIGVSDDTSYGLAFLIGLVASVSTCMAVTGGLLVAAAAKYNESTGTAPGVQRLAPLLYFNLGRVISYTAFGGAIGALGSALTLSAHTNGILTLAVSAVMIVLGLQMLKLLPSFGWLMPKTSSALAHKLHDLAGKEAKGGAFILGAATFFLPCGFTQALQLYVLANGSATIGALTMLAFALGTLPALMSLSALASFARGAFQRHFLKFAGAAVVVFGLLNVQAGLVLTNGDMNAPAADQVASSAISTPIPEGPAQMLTMKVDGLDYFPNRFTVIAGQPVEWRIDGKGASGCGRMLISPGLGIRAILEDSGDTIIRFVPREPGDYAFNCGMGMMTRNSAITVVPQG